MYEQVSTTGVSRYLKVETRTEQGIGSLRTGVTEQCLIS